MLVVGIDPGIHGGIAAVDSVDGIVLLDDLPILNVSRGTTKQTRNELDVAALAIMLGGLPKIAHCFIEKVGPMPKQGLASVWRFGYAAGTILGVVVTLGIAHTLITPQRWQMALAVGSSPDTARQRAMQLYPAVAYRLKRKRDGDRGAALLIAHAGRHLLEHPAPVLAPRIINRVSA